MMRKLCGDTSLKNVVLVSTFWDAVWNYRAAIAREEELKTQFWRPFIQHGAIVARHSMKDSSSADLVKLVLKNQKTILDLQRELVDEKRTLLDTTIGRDLGNEIKERISIAECSLLDIRNMVKEIEAERPPSQDSQRREQFLQWELDLEAVKISQIRAEAGAMKEIEKLKKEIAFMDDSKEVKQLHSVVQ
jgi:hypothetical protein